MNCSRLRSISSTENILGVVPRILKATRHVAAPLLSLVLCISAQSPTALLEEADRLSDTFNLTKAQPLYRQAESAFRRAGDLRNELRAKIGQLRYRVQLGHYKIGRAHV